MTDRTKSIRCVVSGRVQGVFYRASTAQRARQLGIHGWAKNLPDGTVEVVMGADEDAISALCAWLWQGPPSARVTGVSVEQWEGSIESDFRVL